MTRVTSSFCDSALLSARLQLSVTSHSVPGVIGVIGALMTSQGRVSCPGAGGGVDRYGGCG